MLEVWGIQLTAAQIANYLGNTHHESGGFTVTIENLNYSSKGLLTTFPKYFNAAQAVAYARQPERIANRVYANRMDNGPESSGDGWKHRGAGCIQLTGKENQEYFRTWLITHKLWRHEDQDINAELIANNYFWETGLFFFSANNLWQQARYIDDEAIKTLRRRINGGTFGLLEVRELTKKYYTIARQ